MPRPPVAPKVQGSGALPPGPPLRGLAVGEACWPLKAHKAILIGGEGREPQRGLVFSPFPLSSSTLLGALPVCFRQTSEGGTDARGKG